MERKTERVKSENDSNEFSLEVFLTRGHMHEENSNKTHWTILVDISKDLTQWLREAAGSKNGMFTF